MKVFNKFTQLADINLIGIFIGIISGLAINLCTGDAPTLIIWKGVGCMAALIICLLYMINIRQEIEGEYDKRKGEEGSYGDKWDAAVRSVAAIRKFLFGVCILLLIPTLIGGIHFTIKGKSEQSANEVFFADIKKETAASQKKIDSSLKILQKIEENIARMDSCCNK